MFRDNGGSADHSHWCFKSTYLSPLVELVVQVEATSAGAVRDVGLTYTPNRGHRSIWMRLQKSDPISNMRADVWRPAFYLEPKYSVTMLTRKEWIRRPGTPAAIKELLWFTVGSKTPGETGTGFYGQSLGRRFSICPGKYTTVFQAEIYAILACAYKIQADVRLEKYVSI
jgi:hypothetical protein